MESDLPYINTLQKRVLVEVELHEYFDSVFPKLGRCYNIYSARLRLVLYSAGRNVMAFWLENDLLVHRRKNSLSIEQAEKVHIYYFMKD
jgi:hypothetical protein